VNHRVTVTGLCALTSAIERSRKFRRLSDSSPHLGIPFGALTSAIWHSRRTGYLNDRSRRRGPASARWHLRSSIRADSVASWSIASLQPGLDTL